MHLLHEDLTSLILKTFYEVYNELGYGFLEKVYQNALLIELRKKGLEATPNKKIKVFYTDKQVCVQDIASKSYSKSPLKPKLLMEYR